MKKIIIFGFPHSGTTILRTIIDHIPEVYTHVQETRNITKEMITNANKENKSIILIKYPYVIDLDKYKDYVKIFLIRNPLWIFSSLNIRFADKDKLPNGHDLVSYYKMAKMFRDTKTQKIKKLYHIRYEDMFDNNYRNLKIMFNKMGLKYTDKIFSNTKYFNSNSYNQYKETEEDRKMILEKNVEAYKGNYRTWQINQQFKNMNYSKKVKIKKRQMRFLQEKIHPLNIYDIKKIRFRKKE